MISLVFLLMSCVLCYYCKVFKYVVNMKVIIFWVLFKIRWMFVGMS